MKLKKVFIILILLVLLSINMLFGQNEKYDKLSRDYFIEVAIGTEYGLDLKAIKKWVDDVIIYIDGEDHEYLVEEMKKITVELNELIKPITFSFTDNIEEANYIVFFGSGEDYSEKYEPNAESYVVDNWGLFWCYWNTNYEIKKASLYVDPNLTDTKTAGRHILREEFTQSLGLMRESSRYRSSIFYDGWSTITAYAKIDRELIQILYDERIKPAMTLQEVTVILSH